MKPMAGDTFNRQTVIDLMNQGYQVITNGIPEKLDIDLWEYLDTLDDESDVLVLEDLLTWTDRQLSLIGDEAA